MKIGFRIPGKAKEISFEALCHWAFCEGFGSIDLAGPDGEQFAAAQKVGLEIGTIDLPGTKDLLSPDPQKQSAGVEAGKTAIAAAAEHGCKRMFCVFFPENFAQSRADSFAIWKETFPAVAACAEECDIRIAMEGWPGPKPHYPALGCTSEMWRAMFEAVPTPAFGLNYDPSHLVRIGVDYRTHWARCFRLRAKPSCCSAHVSWYR